MALEITLGTLIIEIDIVAAPVTAANFLRYADAGAYDGWQFHRTVTPDNYPDNHAGSAGAYGENRDLT